MLHVSILQHAFRFFDFASIRSMTMMLVLTSNQHGSNVNDQCIKLVSHYRRVHQDTIIKRQSTAFVSGFCQNSSRKSIFAINDLLVILIIWKKLTNTHKRRKEKYLRDSERQNLNIEALDVSKSIGQDHISLIDTDFHFRYPPIFAGIF